MPTTTNFGWTTPADTDLVKDGALAIRTLGNGIDTSMVDLKGGTTGQILSKASNTDMDFTWIANDQGDITGVTAGTGLTGGGTSGSVTLTNDMATTITAAGDIVVGTGSGTYDNLPIGTTGQVLTADTTVSPYKVKWATAASGGGYTLLNSGGTALSGGTVNITSISGSYTDLYLVLEDWQAGSTFNVRFNNSSSNNYYQTGTTVNGSGSGSLKGNAEASGLDMGISPSSGDQQNISIIYIRNYASTNSAKVGTIQHFAKASTNREMSFVGIGFYDATAITEINLIVNSSATFSGGTYYLYGVK